MASKKQEDAMPFVVVIFLFALVLPILGSVVLPFVCYYLITQKILKPYSVNFHKNVIKHEDKLSSEHIDENLILGRFKFDRSDIVHSDDYLIRKKDSIMKMKKLIEDIQELRDSQRLVKVRKDGLWEERTTKSKEANILLEKYRDDAVMLSISAGISTPDSSFESVIDSLSQKDNIRYNYISFILFLPTIPITFVLIQGKLLDFLKTIEFYSFINDYDLLQKSINLFDLGFSFIPVIVITFVIGPVLKAISDSNYPLILPKELHYQCDLEETKWLRFRDCESVVDERDITMIQDCIETSSINFNRTLIEHLEIVKDEEKIQDTLNFLNKQIDNRDLLFEQNSKNLLIVGIALTITLYLLLVFLGLDGLYNIIS